MAHIKASSVTVDLPVVNADSRSLRKTLARFIRTPGCELRIQRTRSTPSSAPSAKSTTATSGCCESIAVRASAIDDASPVSRKSF